MAPIQDFPSDNQSKELFNMDPEDTSDVVEVQMDQAKAMLAQMTALGQPVKAIAETLGRSEAWVRSHRKDEDVKVVVMALQREAIESAQAAITSSSVEAAQKLRELITNPNPGISLAACKDILDRLGLRAVERKEVTTTVVTADPEERKRLLLERIKRLELSD